MLQREANEGIPINKPRAYEEDKKQRKKCFQKKRWFKKGGYDVPLFVPHTPGGELAKRMRMKEAQNNQGRRTRFKIVEKGWNYFRTTFKKIKPVGWRGL